MPTEHDFYVLRGDSRLPNAKEPIQPNRLYLHLTQASALDLLEDLLKIIREQKYYSETLKLNGELRFKPKGSSSDLLVSNNINKCVKHKGCDKVECWVSWMLSGWETLEKTQENVSLQSYRAFSLEVPLHLRRRVTYEVLKFRKQKSNYSIIARETNHEFDTPLSRETP